MIFQLLRPLVAVIPVPDGACPDSSGYPSNDTILCIHAVAEKERKIWGKFIYVHAPAQIIFNISKTVRECKRQLSNRVCTSFGNMIATDGYTIEVADFIIYKIFLYITH